MESDYLQTNMNNKAIIINAIKILKEFNKRETINKIRGNQPIRQTNT